MFEVIVQEKAVLWEMTSLQMVFCRDQVVGLRPGFFLFEFYRLVQSAVNLIRAGKYLMLGRRRIRRIL